jgi:hypothetical protein
MPSENVSSHAKLRELARGAIQEVEAVIEFQVLGSAHPCWPELTADMPADLRELYDSVEKADEERVEVSQKLHEARGRLNAVRAQMRSGGEQAIQPRTCHEIRSALSPVRQRVRALVAQHSDAIVAWRSAGKKLTADDVFRRWCDYELGKRASWLEERRVLLADLTARLGTTFDALASALNGLSGRLGLNYPDGVKANSACEVVVRLARKVLTDVSDVSEGLDFDGLRRDVDFEIGRLCESAGATLVLESTDKLRKSGVKPLGAGGVSC